MVIKTSWRPLPARNGDYPQVIFDELIHKNYYINENKIDIVAS